MSLFKEIMIIKNKEIEYIYNDDYIVSKIHVNKLLKTNNIHFQVYLSGYLDIINKIENHENSVNLNNIAKIRGGFMGFQYHAAGQNIINSEIKENYLKIITPAHLNKFKIYYNKKVRLFKKNYTKPIIKKDPLLINEKIWNFFKSKKIVVRGVSRTLTAAYDDEGYAILVNIYGIILNENKISKYYLLGLLNSELYDFYHKNTYLLARIPKGSLRYPKPFFENLPILVPITTKQKEIHNMINDIVMQILNKDNTIADLSNIIKNYVMNVNNNLEFDVINIKFNKNLVLDPFYIKENNKYLLYLNEFSSTIKFNSLVKVNYVKCILDASKLTGNINIPVPKHDEDVINIMTELEKEISKSNRKSINENIKEINKLVYELYNINNNDITKIKNFIKLI
jgi:hypothetical protein